MPRLFNTQTHQVPLNLVGVQTTSPAKCLLPCLWIWRMRKCRWRQCGGSRPRELQRKGAGKEGQAPEKHCSSVGC